MGQSVKARVRKRREALRAQGLRPVQIWVPDARRPAFDAECRRQSRVVAAADLGDPELLGFLHQAAAEIQDAEIQDAEIQDAEIQDDGAA